MSDDPVQQSYERGYVWMAEENARLQERVAELEEEAATRDADYGPLLLRVLDFVSRDDVQAVDCEADAIAGEIRWRLPAS
jgi:hypothetical protein